MTIRGVHRWLALVLVAPLVVWSVTGLLFHLKPGWARAYDMLDPEEPLTGAPFIAVDAAMRAGAPSGEAVHKVELFGTVLGPLYRVTTAKGEQLVDASAGTVISPLAPGPATALAVAAVARSTYRADYGAPLAATADATTVHQAFANATVDIDRASGRLSQRGADTDRIDWLYRLHYLQWTGNHAIDRVLAVIGLALIWATAGAGLVLFFRRRKRSS